jgi:putative sterol carrier protein
MAKDEIAESVRAIFDEMPKRLSPEAAKGVDVVVRFQLTGSAGGTYFLEIQNGAAHVSSRSNRQPQLSVSVSAADFVALVGGQLNGQLAFLNGKLKMLGDMGLAMKLPTLFRCS